MICIEPIQTEEDTSLIMEEYVFPESPNQELVLKVEESLKEESLKPVLKVEEPVIEEESLKPVLKVEEPVIEEESLEPVPLVELSKKPINRHRKPWSNSEVARLYHEYQINRYTIDQIAEMHGRTYYAIVGKLKTENILYDVEEEEETYYLQEEDDEDDEEDDDDDEDEHLPLTLQLPSSFSTFARAYCYAAEYVVDTIFSAASCVYNAFLGTKTKKR